MVQPPSPTIPRVPFPLRDDQPTFEQRRFAEVVRGTRREWVTLAIVAANVAVFAATVAGGLSPTSPDAESLLAWGANFDPLTRGGQWWRLASSMFLHVGAFHLLMNMYALWQEGRVVERVYGRAAFAFIYAVSGLAGSAASVLAPPTAVSAGASGAVFGVFGAVAAFLVRRRSLLPAAVFRPLRNAVITLIAINVAFGFAVAWIDQAAHLGGLTAGFLAGLLLVPSIDPRGALVRPRAPLALVGGAMIAIVLAVILWP